MLEGAKLIGAGCATIALAGAAVGIGNVFSSLIHSVARNPSLAKQLFGYGAPCVRGHTKCCALVDIFSGRWSRLWPAERNQFSGDQPSTC
jgi:hypothetical protein